MKAQKKCLHITKKCVTIRRGFCEKEGNMMAATHDGHRKRMRERFRISGLEGFSEHEVLELVLFYGRARGNVNDTAHALMDVFGSLPRVLEASPEQLMLIDGIGEESATLLSLILPLFRRYSDEVNQVRSKLESRQVTLDYCRTMMAGYRREQFYVICLTADGSIICNRKVTEGTLSAVTAYPRLVLEAALNSNAHSVVLCHNHPGGVALPSEDDICTTRYLQQLLEGVGIIVLDHVIVAGNQTYSMAQHGELLHPSEIMRAMVAAAEKPLRK